MSSKPAAEDAAQATQRKTNALVGKASIDKVDAGDSDITDNEDITEELEEIQDDNIRAFYQAIPDMHKLAQVIDTHRKMRRSDLGKVLARDLNSATTGRDVLTSQRAKKYRREIYAGTGFDTPASRPYRPFEFGVSFLESSAEQDREVKELLHQNKLMKQERKGNEIELTEISLDQDVKARAARYERKCFFFDLAKVPRAQIKGKAIAVTCTAINGDPDLYMSVAEPPTEREYVWKSMQEGADQICIHPDDPNYLIGTYYITVYCTSSASEFFIKATAHRPMQHDDSALFGRAQASMYESIRSTIRDTNHRLKLCAGGKSWLTQLQRDAKTLAQDVKRNGHRLKLCAGGKSWLTQLQRDAKTLAQDVKRNGANSFIIQLDKA
eukprot:CAMPEP_0184326248 /NCGR_PEP_ID=MMETSP1049-20130417/142463_1 /TAXON_ID=77928 /ORGANISM="Proteomonas sulcata, Strain CCMP704" /LENGTH=381 /DNA_ID=CAMNT_0026648431 /DNA_START=125 /DNA_END=1270 /DNA_ORIENTATION=-